MTSPLFLKVTDQLINLALCERITVEDETLSFATASDSFDFEYDSEEEAAQALNQIQQILESGNLLLGKLP